MTLKYPYKQGGMFEGATHHIFENAKHLRKNITETENILWNHLRKGINGFKFRRQHPIGIYIADFFCHKAKLVIELDGSVHNKEDVKVNDDMRQKVFQNWGYAVIRFKNEQVFKKIDDVLNNISEIVNNIIKNKSPNIGV